jgi:hypothetical protein
MKASRKLSEIAKTNRSKNAGVDKITFDVIFPDRATHDRVRESGVLSHAAVCQIFGIDATTNLRPRRIRTGIGDQVHDIPPDTEWQPGDADIFGSQQYRPLLDIDVLAR